jgi:hypothetical protein
LIPRLQRNQCRCPVLDFALTFPSERLYGEALGKARLLLKTTVFH